MAMSTAVAERLAAWLRRVPNVVSAEVHAGESCQRIELVYRVHEPIGWRRVTWDFGRLDPRWMQSFKRRREAEALAI